MIELARFIFSSFWVWAGTVVLVGLVTLTLGEVARVTVLMLMGRGR